MAHGRAARGGGRNLLIGQVAWQQHGNPRDVREAPLPVGVHRRSELPLVQLSLCVRTLYRAPSLAPMKALTGAPSVLAALSRNKSPAFSTEPRPRLRRRAVTRTAWRAEPVAPSKRRRRRPPGRGSREVRWGRSGTGSLRTWRCVWSGTWPLVNYLRAYRNRSRAGRRRASGGTPRTAARAARFDGAAHGRVRG